MKDHYKYNNYNILLLYILGARLCITVILIMHSYCPIIGERCVFFSNDLNISQCRCDLFMTCYMPSLF